MQDHLIYLDDFITPEEERLLLHTIMSRPWKSTRSRDMQAYGFQYLKGEHGVPLHEVEPIPESVHPILKRINQFCQTTLHEHSSFDQSDLQFRQMTVNKYLPGQGIDPHYDHKTRFGPVIVGLTLGSGCTIIFEEPEQKGEKGERRERREIYLKPRSFYLMSGKYRYEWTHKIRKVHYDTVEGKEVKREVRISLTFRMGVSEPKVTESHHAQCLITP